MLYPIKSLPYTMLVPSWVKIRFSLLRWIRWDETKVRVNYRSHQAPESTEWTGRPRRVYVTVGYARRNTYSAVMPTCRPDSHTSMQRNSNVCSITIRWSSSLKITILKRRSLNPCWATFLTSRTRHQGLFRRPIIPSRLCVKHSKTSQLRK